MIQNINRVLPEGPDLVIEYDKGEADQVQGRCCVPQITLERREGGNPSWPEHGADDDKGEQGINREKYHGHMEKATGLGYHAILERRRAAQEIEHFAPDVHDQVRQCPDNHCPPADWNQCWCVWTDADERDAEQQFEDAERDADRETQKKRACEKTLNGIGFLFAWAGAGFRIVQGHGIVGIGCYSGYFALVLN